MIRQYNAHLMMYNYYTKDEENRSSIVYVNGKFIVFENSFLLCEQIVF